jgi:hypothetical protein
MTKEVRTPFSVSAVELSGGGLYRKQVLRFGSINYVDPRTGKRRKLTFDSAYGRRLIEAFRSGAYPQVPFQLADGDNRHNNDPRNTGGEVVGVELSRDGSGVDGILRVWGDGARVVETNPRLGVSARIFENVALTDGRTFPVAMQHVLGTVDPQIRDMRPWEKVGSVDLSNGTVSEALDLSTATYERSAPMSGENGKGNGTVTLELSPERAARLEQLLDEDEALEALGDELGDLLDDDAEDEGSDETEDVEPTELSTVGTQALELATSQIGSLNRRVIELSNQLNEQRTNGELAGYMGRGLAPAVVKAAQPLLSVESGAIELSNGVAGDAVDPGAVIREVLDTVIELSNSGMLLIDVDDETGRLEGSDKRKSEREALLADWENYG